MKVLIMGALKKISDRIYSHDSAAAFLFADMLKIEFPDWDIDIETSKMNLDPGDYKMVCLYHGATKIESLNLFGGLSNIGAAEQLQKVSNLKGHVISIDQEMPDYDLWVKSRLSGKSEYPDIWDNINFDNLSNLKKSRTVKLSTNFDSKAIIIGDSHAISLYKPKYAINSVPFQTLFGALEKGFKSFLPRDKDFYDEVGFYFGNIDIRHHLLRLSPELDKAILLTGELVEQYVKAILELDVKNPKIYVPLPIEHKSRKIPKSGFYKGEPFHGSQNDRMKIRDEFINFLNIYTENTNIEIITWCEYLLNDKGELDFKYMEKPRSVHLSREFYPFLNNSSKVDSTGLF